jgi:hypothetical protein
LVTVLGRIMVQAVGMFHVLFSLFLSTTRKLNILGARNFLRGEIKPPRIYHYLGGYMKPPRKYIFLSSKPNNQVKSVFP